MQGSSPAFGSESHPRGGIDQGQALHRREVRLTLIQDLPRRPTVAG